MFPSDARNGCNYLTTGSCPLQEGDEASYEISTTISGVPKNTTGHAELILRNEDLENLICTRFPAKFTGGNGNVWVSSNEAGLPLNLPTDMFKEGFDPFKAFKEMMNNSKRTNKQGNGISIQSNIVQDGMPGSQKISQIVTKNKQTTLDTEKETDKHGSRKKGTESKSNKSENISQEENDNHESNEEGSKPKSSETTKNGNSKNSKQFKEVFDKASEKIKKDTFKVFENSFK